MAAFKNKIVEYIINQRKEKIKINFLILEKSFSWPLYWAYRRNSGSDQEAMNRFIYALQNDLKNMESYLDKMISYKISNLSLYEEKLVFAERYLKDLINMRNKWKP